MYVILTLLLGLASASTDLAGTLRTVRLAQGRGLRGVAADAGIDPGALSKIERGLRQPRADTLRRICTALGLTKAEALLGTLVPDRQETGHAA